MDKILISLFESWRVGALAIPESTDLGRHAKLALFRPHAFCTRLPLPKCSALTSLYMVIDVAPCYRASAVRCLIQRSLLSYIRGPSAAPSTHLQAWSLCSISLNRHTFRKYSAAVHFFRDTRCLHPTMAKGKQSTIGYA